MISDGVDRFFIPGNWDLLERPGEAFLLGSVAHARVRESGGEKAGTGGRHDSFHRYRSQFY